MSTPTVGAVLPTLLSVRNLLEDLLGRDIDVKVGDAWSPTPADYAAVAEFTDDHGRLRAIALLDIALAVYLGASIGLIPAGGAQDMVSDKRPTSMVIENLYEVLNVLSATFNEGSGAHLRIYKLHAPGDAFPPDVSAASRRLVGRLDLGASVKGYGAGRLALILTD